MNKLKGGRNNSGWTVSKRNMRQQRALCVRVDKSIHLTHFEPIFQFSTIVFSLIFYAVPIFYPLISVCYQKNENDFRILSELSACLNSTFKVKKDILFQVNGAQHYSNFLKKLNIKSLKPKKNKIETI